MPWSFLHFEQARFLQVLKGASKMVQEGFSRVPHCSHLQGGLSHTQTALVPLHFAHDASFALSCSAFAAAVSFFRFCLMALQIALMQLAIGLMTWPQVVSSQRT